MALLVDRQGNLWVGTAYGGLNKIDPDRKRITRYVHQKTNPNTISSNRIQDIVEDDDGNIWVGTDRGLDQLNPVTNSIKHFSSDPDIKGTLSDPVISKMMLDAQNNLWVGTIRNGINRFNKNNQLFSREYSRLLPESMTRSIYQDPTDGNIIWVGLRLKGLAKLNVAQRKVTVIDELTEPIGLPSNYIRAISKDVQNRIWVGTPSGLALIDSNDKVIKVFTHNPANKYSLSSHDISSLFLDNNGVLWIGTLGGGLNRCDTKIPKFGWIHSGSDKNRKLPNNYVWTFLKDSKNRLWVGTDAGITVFDDQKHVIKQINKENSGLPSDYLQALYEDNTGKIWIGTYRGLAIYISDKDKVIDGRTFLTGELPNYSITCFVPYDSAHLWVGTENGLSLVNIHTGECENHLVSRDTPPSSSSIVYAIQPEYEKNLLWVGTYGGGVVKYDFVSGAREFINSLNAKPKQLSNDYVFSIIQDPEEKDILWIGTRTGLNRLSKSTGSITYFTEDDGLPNDVIYGLLFDKQNQLWISTNNGLTRFNPIKTEFRNFDIDDGLQSNEFNARAYYKSKDGEMYFGGINGFNFFYPEKIHDNRFAPDVQIQQLMVMDEVFDIGALNEQSNLSFPYNQNFLTFSFFLPEFSAPAKNRYRYILSGLENDWHITSRNQALYTNLPQGTYQFKVVGANNDGVWSERFTVLKFTILPPPWKSWWAYILYAVAFGAIIYGIIQFRIYEVKERERIKRAELRLQIAEAEKRAIEIEHQKNTAEMQRAKELQLAMLPKQPPQYPFLEIKTFMETASLVGGDYYDFIPIDDKQLYAFLGDATGHGLPAGMTVALTKSGLHAIRREQPVEILKRLNVVLKEILTDKFYMALHVLQINQNTVTIASAAMPPIYYYNARLKKVVEILLPTLPLGTRLPENYQEISINPALDDKLIILSDGLPERLNVKGLPLGYDLIKDCIEEHAGKSVDELMGKLLNLGELHSQGQNVLDDVTIMILHFKKTVL